MSLITIAERLSVNTSDYTVTPNPYVKGQFEVRKISTDQRRSFPIFSSFNGCGGNILNGLGSYLYPCTSQEDMDNWFKVWLVFRTGLTFDANSYSCFLLMSQLDKYDNVIVFLVRHGAVKLGSVNNLIHTGRGNDLYHWDFSKSFGAGQQQQIFQHCRN